MKDPVVAELRKDWWVPTTLGVISMLFGFMALIWPGVTLAVLAVLMAVLIAVYGVMDLIGGVKRVSKDVLSGLLITLLGVLETGVAVYLFHNRGTGLTIATFVFVVAIALIARGVLGVFNAFNHNISPGWRWMSAIIGLLYVAAGIYIVNYPVEGSLAFIWILGLMGLLTGPLYIALGFELRDGKI